MDEEIKNTSEDVYTDIDFEDEEKELKASEFINVPLKSIKIKEVEEGKMSQFFDEKEKLVGEKIIHKKSGKIIEIKYNDLGLKTSYSEKSKDKKLIKVIDYYENGSIKLTVDYKPDGSYKSLMYNIDGSRLSYVEKHPDGTADAIYYNADTKGGTLYVKLDKNKEPIEKRVEY